MMKAVTVSLEDSSKKTNVSVLWATARSVMILSWQRLPQVVSLTSTTKWPMCVHHLKLISEICFHFFQYKIIRKKANGKTQTEEKEADDDAVGFRQRGPNSVIRFCVPTDELDQTVVLDTDPIFIGTQGEEDPNSGGPTPNNYNPATGDFFASSATRASTSVLASMLSLLVIGKIFF